VSSVVNLLGALVFLVVKNGRHSGRPWWEPQEAPLRKALPIQTELRHAQRLCRVVYGTALELAQRGAD
jgi:hypothetical protein